MMRFQPSYTGPGDDGRSHPGVSAVPGSQLRKIGNHNNKLIVQVTCGRCRDSFFLHVEFAGSIVNAVEEVTRVAAPSPRDADEIDGDPLTHDEVLDAHQRLAAFQGKLTELLED